MKSFLKKYKRTIIFWIIFSAIVLYFAPKQNEYYLDDDIQGFKSRYLIPILFWTGVIASILLLSIIIVINKSIKKSLFPFLYGTAIMTFYLFIFQNLFLAGSLFINRKFNRDSVQKAYIVSYWPGTDSGKANFTPYDISTGHFSMDEKLINKLYQTGLTQGDTLVLKFDTGLFGVAFQKQPFVDK